LTLSYEFALSDIEMTIPLSSSIIFDTPCCSTGNPDQSLSKILYNPCSYSIY